MSTFEAFGQVSLQEVLQNRLFDQVAELLDGLELQVTTPQLPQDWPHIIHLLGHLYNFDLEDARFLWKRIPNASKQDPELKAAFSILQQLWNKGYEGTWAALSGFAWQPAAAPLVTALGERVRERTLGVLTGAYNTISGPRAASFLGLSEADAIILVQQAGWEHDPASGLLKVHQQPAAAALPSHAEHLDRLTSYMIHLESSASASAGAS